MQIYIKEEARKNERQSPVVSNDAETSSTKTIISYKVGNFEVTGNLEKLFHGEMETKFLLQYTGEKWEVRGYTICIFQDLMKKEAHYT